VDGSKGSRGSQGSKKTAQRRLGTFKPEPRRQSREGKNFFLKDKAYPFEKRSRGEMLQTRGQRPETCCGPCIIKNGIQGIQKKPEVRESRPSRKERSLLKTKKQRKLDGPSDVRPAPQSRVTARGKNWSNEILSSRHYEVLRKGDSRKRVQAIPYTGKKVSEI